MKNKIFIACTVASLVMTAAAVTASADDAQGTCGAGASWTYTESTATLAVTGSGAISDYSKSNLPPWSDYYDKIEHVSVSDGITAIGDFAFSSFAKTKDVTLGNDIRSIGNYSFEFEYALTSINMPQNLEKIGEEAFTGCSALTSFSLPATVSAIGDDAFQYCQSITAVNADSDNANFSSADGVLFNKDKTKLIYYPTGRGEATYEIPSSVNTIVRNAFCENQSISAVTIPDSVTSIAESAFFDCSSLTYVYVPGSVSTIEYATFYGCKNLGSVVIGSGTKILSENAFRKCAGLVSISIPASVDTIDDSAFLSDANVEIFGYSSSAADTFASANNIPFNAYTNVLIDDAQVTFDQLPFVKKGRTLVPMRAIFENLGATVTWDQATRTAHAEKSGTTIDITIGSTAMMKNGSSVELDVPAEVDGDRTLVPLRAVSEAFGVKVVWDDQNFLVKMYK